MFSCRSRVTYVAQHIAFSVMMADAAMVEHVICVDVSDAAQGRWDAPVMRGMIARPGQRELRMSHIYI